MTGLLVFAGLLVAILYCAGVFYVGAKIQDWASAHGYPDVLLPWVFVMVVGIALPISIAAEFVGAL